MVYEYCDEIKNSGICRDIPTSCSFMEMGMHAAYDCLKELNVIMNEAGMVELDKFKNGTLTEASNGNMLKNLGDKISKAFTKFWEKIKAAWEAILKFFDKRREEMKSKALKKFKETDLSEYKKGISKIKLAINPHAFNTINELQDKLAKFKSIDIAKVREVKDNYYEYLFKSAGIPAANVENNLESAKKVIDNQIRKPSELTADWIIRNKDLIVKVVENSTVEINKAYRDAKRAMDSTIKDIKKYEKADRTAEFVYTTFKLSCSFQSLMLYLADIRKAAFLKMCALVYAVNSKCTKSGKGDPNAIVKVGEGGTPDICYNTDFVNEAFNW